jgi:hypothetical protein
MMEAGVCEDRASGRSYRRAFVIYELVRRYATLSQEAVPIEDCRCRGLGRRHVFVYIYTLARGAAISPFADPAGRGKSFITNA